MVFWLKRKTRNGKIYIYIFNIQFFLHFNVILCYFYPSLVSSCAELSQIKRRNNEKPKKFKNCKCGCCLIIFSNFLKTTSFIHFSSFFTAIFTDFSIEYTFFKPLESAFYISSFSPLIYSIILLLWLPLFTDYFTPAVVPPSFTQEQAGHSLVESIPKSNSKASAGDPLEHGAEM